MRSWIEWKKIRRQFRNEWNQLPRQRRAGHARERAHDQTFENEEPQDAAAGSAQRHAQRDLAPSSAKAHEQKIGHVTARDQENEPNRGEESAERRPEIAAHILWQGLEEVRDVRVDLARIFRARIAG